MRLLVSILAAALVLFAENASVEVVSANLRVTASDTDVARSVGRQAASCSVMVDSALGFSGAHLKQLHIEVVSRREGRRAVRKRSRITFNLEDNLLEEIYWLCRALVERRCREQIGASVSEEFLHFAAAALAYRRAAFMQRTMHFPGTYDYQAAATQFSRGSFPNAGLLYSLPVQADSLALFQMHAMHCDLLLRALEHLTPNRRDLVAALAGASPETPLSTLLEPFLGKERTLQQYYEREAAAIGKPQAAAVTPDEILQRIDAACRLPLIKLENPDAVSEVCADDFPKALAERRLGKPALMECQVRLRRLEMEAPYMMVPGIEALALAVGALMDGSPRQFRKELDAARKQLAESRDRLRQINTVLDEVEREQLSLREKYALQFDIFAVYEQRQEALLPWSGAEMEERP